MPAAKRKGHEGRRVEWPWADRGRSAVTRESVRADLIRLGMLVAQGMREARSNERPTVRVEGEGWV